MYQSNRAYKGVGFTPVILFEQTCQIQDLVETPSSSVPTLISCPGFNLFHAHQWYSSIVKSPLKIQSCLMILCKGSASSELPTNSFSVAVSLMTLSWQMATVAHSDLLMSSCHSNHPVKLQNILCFIAEKIRESGHSSGGSSNLPANATLILVWQRRFWESGLFRSCTHPCAAFLVRLSQALQPAGLQGAVYFIAFISKHISLFLGQDRRLCLLSVFSSLQLGIYWFTSLSSILIKLLLKQVIYNKNVISL